MAGEIASASPRNDRLLRRCADWPSRLEQLLAERRHRAFEWGVHDCCLFAADAVEVMTDVDPAFAFRARYRTRAGAARVLRRHGGFEDLIARLATAFGMAAVAPLQAGRGDVVCFVTPLPKPCSGSVAGLPALGIVALNGEIAAAGPDGLVFLPLRAATRAWAV